MPVPCNSGYLVLWRRRYLRLLVWSRGALGRAAGCRRLLRGTAGFLRCPVGNRSSLRETELSRNHEEREEARLPPQKMLTAEQSQAERVAPCLLVCTKTRGCAARGLLLASARQLLASAMMLEVIVHPLAALQDDVILPAPFSFSAEPQRAQNYCWLLMGH